MKIASGKAKGHYLKKPIIPDNTMSLSFERLPLFEILQNQFGFSFTHANVLDLFAGSGAFGLEALSHGAEHVDFVDKHAHACKTILENMNHSYFLGKGSVHQRNVRDYLLDCYTLYNIIFLDPDHQYSCLGDIIRALPQKLAPKGIIICKIQKGIKAPSWYPFLIKNEFHSPDGMIYILQTH